ncbi:MAG: hypothetical protein FD157_1055 [Rhodocyclaceae bacterium]|nr:MAG: hypothetical protein FD157_1055 [Rhodocyclaceae bacterium]TND06081.1 MAG: hypothetical protein FD118_153 [Rhodocyclaceae bacterium]
MRKAYCWLAILLSFGIILPVAAQTQNAARADFVVGAVTAVGADGTRRALAKGSALRSGEAVMTGEGRAQLSFTDGASVSLQPKTEFRVDEYNFTGVADGSEKGIFSLVKGALRTITGLVGRANRDRYQMRTAVATIGIRGTEYGAEFETGLKVTTTNGEVEVCNQGGCTSVKAGESVFTPDANTRPAYIVGGANLPATPPPSNPTLFAGGEVRTATGGIPIPTLPSGPGYSVVYSGFDDGIGFALDSASGTATFDQVGGMSTFSDGTNADKATTHVEAMTDGAVAWGRWAGGTVGGNPVTNVHYVVGVPTPASAVASLTNTVFPQGVGKASYGLMSATLPTAANGTVGGALTGSLTVQFGATTNVNTTLVIPIGGGSYTVTNTGMTGTFPAFSDPGASMACSGACVGAASTAKISGSFFGPSAERAGLIYNFGGATTLGDVTGAAVFKR